MRRGEEDRYPLIVEVKGHSLDDGPGIRTVVFFKGCPLACVWCHNPEARYAGAELSFDDSACIGSHKCLKVCEDQALDPGHEGFVNRDRCTLCFRCTEVCPAEALQRVGRYWEVEEVVKAVMPYVPFYRTSGGGVTLSGGEPLLFMGYAAALLTALRAQGIHTLVETSGYFDWSRFEQRILPAVDEIYFDLKVLDPEAHRRFCGRRNEPIVENFRRLQRRYREGGTPVLPRVPLVPGITATAENLSAIAAFLRQNGTERVGLLPYNPLWRDKARKLGEAAPEGSPSWMSREELDWCRSFFEGLAVV